MKESDSPEDRANEPEAQDDDAEKAPKRADGEGTPSEDADSWLKDSARARDAAGFGPMLERAIAELAGSARLKTGEARSGVWITGDVHVSGDMLGGDKHVGARSSAYVGEVVAGEVAAATLRQIERSYVPPPGYRSLQEALGDRRVVLLQAPSGWGRTTTGLHLLTRMCDGAVQKLNPDTDLRRLKPAKDLKAGCGHLLEIRAVDQLDGLKVPHLEELSAACADSDVWLVVTLDEDIRVDDEPRADFGVTGGPRPDLDAVLRRHLEMRFEDFGADDAAASAAQVMDDAKVGEIVGKFVNDTLTMRRVAELADRLARHSQGGIDFDSIDVHYEELSEANFSKWFEETRCAARLAFIVALAALNGMPYITVSQAARKLEDQILAAEADPEDKGRSVLGARKTARLAEARATTTQTTGNTQYGPVRVEGVRFHNDSYPRRVLERVWCEFDDVRPIILEWLRDLGSDRDRAVRIRAAAATGLLATLDFARIHREILLAWADSDDPRVRESAVSALRFPVTQSSELAVHVIRMMRDWSGPHSPRNRRWTAARALGASIGRSIRPEALRLLRRVAADGDLYLSFAVADSVMDLFLDTEENAQSDIMAALVRWTSETAPVPRQFTGMLCFLRLALHVTAEPAEPDNTVWPGLLWLATCQDEAFRRLGILWRRALAAPGQFMTAQTAFANWVAMADGEPPIADALDVLLKRVVRDRYDANRLAEAIEQSVADHGETDATRSLLNTITELEKAL